MAEASSDLGAALARIAQLEDELRQSKQQVTPLVHSVSMPSWRCDGRLPAGVSAAKAKAMNISTVCTAGARETQK